MTVKPIALISAANDPITKALPKVIALITFVMSLLLLMTLSAAIFLMQLNRDQVNELTVQLPASQDSALQQRKLDGLVSVLTAFHSVREVRVLSKTDVAGLLQPWLGDQETISDLPLPSVIAVEVTKDQPFNTEILLQELRAMTPDVILDDHRDWYSSSSRFSGKLLGLLGLLLVAASLSLVGLIAFALKTSLVVHSQTVDVLHMVGASDYFIARQFSRMVLKLSALGASVGAITALLILWLFQLWVSGDNTEADTLLSFSFWYLIPLVILVLIIVWLAGLVTQRVVTKLIRRQRKAA